MFQSSRSEYSIAGKVFILGEYAVLGGAPALVAAVPPRFSMVVEVKKEEGGGEPRGLRKLQELPKLEKLAKDPSHPETPFSLLKSWVAEDNSAGSKSARLQFEFRDPHLGRGGFGGSTAEFAMGFLAYSNWRQYQGLDSAEWVNKWDTVWRLYQDLHRKNFESKSIQEVIMPSGADLVAQWQGGVVFFDPADRTCIDFWPFFDWSNLLVFSATSQPGRKVPTHQHLSDLACRGFYDSKPEWLKALEEPLLRGVVRSSREPAGGAGKGNGYLCRNFV